MSELDEFNKLKNFIDDVLIMNFKNDDLPEIAKKIKSKNRYDQHYGTIGLRKILSGFFNDSSFKLLVQNAPIQ